MPDQAQELWAAAVVESELVDNLTPVVRLSQIYKYYGAGETLVKAVDGISLDIYSGEYVAIMGASGSGKSTLMNIIGCLDIPTKGEYELDGINVSNLDENALAIVRNRKIGFVFQSFNLLPRTSAFSNVELPLVIRGFKRNERNELVDKALAQVGLSDRGHHESSELSGGQQQRVAIARALVSNPSLILADEPTGALDTKSTSDIMDLIDKENQRGRTIILITHEESVASRAQRIIRLSDGKVLEDRVLAKSGNNL